MVHAINTAPSDTSVDTGVRDVEGVAEGLRDILADTYRLIFKTHAYHWNVEGPMFFSIHNLTEEQYNNMFQAADEVAERIRALGLLAPHSMADIVANSKITDKNECPKAIDMCKDLAADHERVAHRLHALVTVAGKHNDPVTEDLATERSAFHEKAAWMLRAISAE